MAVKKSKKKVDVYSKNVKSAHQWMKRMSKKKGKLRKADKAKLLHHQEQYYKEGEKRRQQMNEDLELARLSDKNLFKHLHDYRSSSDEDEEDTNERENKPTSSKRIKLEKSDESDEELLELKYSHSNFASAQQQNDDENLKHFLPIKTLSGKIVKLAAPKKPERHQKEDLSKNDEVEMDDSENEDHKIYGPQKMDETQESPAAETVSKLFANRAQMLQHFKSQIASYCSQIIENPELNIHKLKPLVQLAKGNDVDPLVQFTVQKLATASLLEVFVDVIPTYYIRPWSETEENQKMKKETKRLHEFEQCLLRNYEKFLQHLESLRKCYETKKLKKTRVSSTIAESFGQLAVKSLSKLLAEHYHFNYRSTLINSLVAFMSDKNEKTRIIACEAVESVFSNDKPADATLDVVKSICKFVKDNTTKSQPRMLETFLHLKIKEIEDVERAAKTKRDILAKKRKIKMMSRKERKVHKRLNKLDKELEDLEGESNRNTVLKNHTQIMNQIFTTYFGVLRRNPKSKILPPVLEGLAKFAHLINVEFFDDLIHSLLDLIQKGNISLTESLHCTKTVFIILSGEGQSLTIDPYGFYRFLYNALPKLARETKKDVLRKQLNLVIECLDYMINKRRKHVTLSRVAAFVKRLADLATKFEKSQATQILNALKTYFVAHPKLDCLLDSENDQIGSGRFLPDLDDPDRCNALNSTILDEFKKLNVNVKIWLR